MFNSLGRLELIRKHLKKRKILKIQKNQDICLKIRKSGQRRKIRTCPAKSGRMVTLADAHGRWLAQSNFGHTPLVAPSHYNRNVIN